MPRYVVTLTDDKTINVSSKAFEVDDDGRLTFGDDKTLDAVFLESTWKFVVTEKDSQ